MLQRLVRTIRQKPKAARDKYALGIALAFTGFVLVGWIWSKATPVPVITATGDDTAADQATNSSLTDMMNTIQTEFSELTTGSASLSATSAPLLPAPTGNASTAVRVSTPVSVSPPAAVRVATFTASTSAR